MPIAIALLAAAAATTLLAPSGKWVIDYREDMCVASRNFGTASDSVTLAIKPGTVVDSSAATLLFVVPAGDDTGLHRGTMTITLQPSGKSVTTNYASWVSAGTKWRNYYVEVDAKFGEAMTPETGLLVSVADRKIALATGRLETAQSALHTCNLDLFKSWGVDSAAKPQPVGSPANWFSDDDYPDGRDGTEKSRGSGPMASPTGRVVIVLTANPNGKPAACRVVSASKAAVLNQVTCGAAMRRARFVPFEGPGTRAMVLSVRFQTDG